MTPRQKERTLQHITERNKQRLEALRKKQASQIASDGEEKAGEAKQEQLPSEGADVKAERSTAEKSEL